MPSHYYFLYEQHVLGHSTFPNLSNASHVRPKRLVTRIHMQYDYTILLVSQGRMNYCLRNKCPKGYAFIQGFPLKLDSHGSFR